MKKKTVSVALGLILLVLFSFGCSSDNPVSPLPAGEISTGAAEKSKPADAHWARIYGNVYYADGTPADDTTVRIDVYNGTYWSTHVQALPTVVFGHFEYETVLWDGWLVRCASLGDVVTKKYANGSASLYFALTEEGSDGKEPKKDPREPPDPER